MVVVMKLLTKLETDTGMVVSCSGAQGCSGMMPVFETAEAAREVYGPDCATLDILAVNERNDL